MHEFAKMRLQDANSGRFLQSTRSLQIALCGWCARLRNLLCLSSCRRAFSPKTRELLLCRSCDNRGPAVVGEKHVGPVNLRYAFTSCIDGFCGYAWPHATQTTLQECVHVANMALSCFEFVQFVDFLSSKKSRSDAYRKLWE